MTTGMNNFDKNKLNKKQSRMLVETSYLSSATALIWIALYYLPIGGAFFRIALPLPLALLQIRRGTKAGVDGVFLTVLLLSILMGPLRGPLILFPYAILSFWLGFCWYKRYSWWLSWFVGVLIGTLGFIIRVFALSILVGENLWVIITRAGASIIEKFLDFTNIIFVPDMIQIQIVGVSLIVLQEIIFVLTLHLIAFWIFPRLKAHVPDPPPVLSRLTILESQ